MAVHASNIEGSHSKVIFIIHHMEFGSCISNVLLWILVQHFFDSFQTLTSTTIEWIKIIYKAIAEKYILTLLFSSIGLSVTLYYYSIALDAFLRGNFLISDIISL